MMLRLFVVAVVTVSVSAFTPSAGASGVDDEARDVLLEAREAILQTRSISYRSRRFVEGLFAGMMDGEGDVQVIRRLGDRGQRSGQRVRGELVIGATDERFKLDAFMDGLVIRWLDDEERVVYERPFRARGPAGNQRTRMELFLIRDLTEDRPFETELTRADRLEVVGIGEVHGEVCEIIRAHRAAGDRDTIWYISVVDRLPRRYEVVSGEGDQRFALVQEIWDVETDHLALTDIRLETPEGFTEDGFRAAAQPDEPRTALRVGLEPGSEAPAYSLRDHKGEEFSSDSVGGKVSVLFFFTTWAAQSRDAAPVIGRIQEEFGDDVKVVALSCREAEEGDFGAFIEEHGLSGVTVLVSADEVAESYQVRGFPSFYVIGRDGRVVEFFQGFADEGGGTVSDRLRETIRKAVEG